MADSKWPIRQFLQDNWTRHGPLRILIQGSLHVSDLHLKVKDTRDANGNWDFSTLFFVLPSHLQDIIHATPKPFHSPSMISFLGIPLRMAASTFIQLIYSPPYSPKLPMLVLKNASRRSPQSQESRPSSGSPITIVSQPKSTSLNDTSAPKHLALSASQELKPHCTFFVIALPSNPSSMSFKIELCTQFL